MSLQLGNVAVLALKKEIKSFQTDFFSVEIDDEQTKKCATSATTVSI